ncbi:MAG TPA: redoxin domain-containing protein [Thermoleophilaceae bacterium]|nr:redoxin domain-containing protein [Thermoleophilaceae bacterium]
MSDLVGREAPDFTLRNQDGKKVTLSELRGQTLVLVFYPLDWSPVCTDQLNLYQEAIRDFGKQDATLYGVSVDSAFSHKAFQQHLGVEFDLLADFEPKGEVARQYGMYLDDHGTNARGFVVIDADGKVKHSHKSPSPLEIPAPDLILDALVV